MVLFIKRNLITIIGAVIGAIGGFIYWQQIGCSTGNCMITSNPVKATIYGSKMGGLLFSLFRKQ
jgi:hypothetical protein